MPKAPLRTVPKNFDDNVPAALLNAADGSTMRVDKSTEYRVNHFAADQTPTSAATLADFKDSKWKLEFLRNGQWFHKCHVEGRINDEVILASYGTGKYRSCPLDQDDQPIIKFQQIHNIGGEDDDLDDRDYEPPPPQYHMPPPPPSMDPMTMVMTMMQNFQNQQAMAESNRQAREDASREREEQRRFDEESRAQQRRDDETAARREEARLSAQREEQREALRKEQDERNKVEQQRREDERVRREEAAATMVAAREEAAQQRQHELQIKMMELQANKQPPQDPSNSPLVTMLLQSVLDSKQPPPQIVNNPTFMEQLTGLKKVQQQVADIFPQHEEPPEKPMQEVLLAALPDITNALVALRGGGAQSADPAAILRQHPRAVAKMAIAEFKRDPQLFEQFTAAMDAEADAQDFSPSPQPALQ